MPNHAQHKLLASVLGVCFDETREFVAHPDYDLARPFFARRSRWNMPAVAVSATAAANRWRRRWGDHAKHLRVRPRASVRAIRRARAPEVLVAARKRGRRIEPGHVRLFDDLPDSEEPGEGVVLRHLDPVDEGTDWPLSRSVHERECRRSVVELDVVDRMLWRRLVDHDRREDVEVGDTRILSGVSAVVRFRAPIVRAAARQGIREPQRCLTVAAGRDAVADEHFGAEADVGRDFEHITQRTYAVGLRVCDRQRDRLARYFDIESVLGTNGNRLSDVDAGNRSGDRRAERVRTFFQSR